MIVTCSYGDCKVLSHMLGVMTRLKGCTCVFSGDAPTKLKVERPGVCETFCRTAPGLGPLVKEM